MTLQVINPANGEPGPEYPLTPPERVPEILAKAHAAFDKWRRRSFEERASVLRRAGALMLLKKDDLARTMAAEMGKPLAQGVGEVEKCAWVCEHYADEAETMLAPERVETEARASEVRFAPLGIVLAIMPWNFPLWQVFRFLAPALMAGNGAVLKHAPNVPGSARAIEDLLREAGLPEDLFANLFIEVEQVAEVIASPAVQAVTLTGSTRAGKAVAATAGAHLKKCVLELGGSDAYIVLEDADLDEAAAACVAGRIVNGGQSCVAAKRWIVVDAVREAFTEKVLARLETEVLGDPFDPATTVGPMARIDLRDELAAQVERSVAAGAKVLLGGQKPEQPGAWYPVTLLDDVKPGMPAFDEELFGPVAAIVPAKDEAEAVELANDSIYGLGGAVFTRDLERGHRIVSDELEAGCCFVNTFVRSDPRLPFGGVKESGYGRELGVFGIREFVNVKTVYVA
ncbi:MAG: NAD-dependent succinate-semialdehyde dehydrogenase [Planctomycetota bacterium]|nr:NAD-dependent succinate-semialdehyde dehydrogenase [Planctomycetota bacterium]